MTVRHHEPLDRTRTRGHPIREWVENGCKTLARYPFLTTMRSVPLGSGPKLDPNQANATFLNPTELNKSGMGARTVVDLVRKAVGENNATVEIWAGETAAANGGGQTGITDTFMNGFWYLDQLGSHALAGVNVMCRQTLLANQGYPLLENYEPLPDLWLTLLYKRIMGQRVLRAKTTLTNQQQQQQQEQLRVYAHCSAERQDDTAGDISLAWLNIGTHEIRLELSELSADTPNATLWVLQPGATMKDNPLMSRELKLNGRVLQLLEGPELPNLDGQPQGEDIVLPPASYGFVQLHNVHSKACATRNEPKQSAKRRHK